MMMMMVMMMMMIMMMMIMDLSKLCCCDRMLKHMLLFGVRYLRSQIANARRDAL